jgi:TPR repeat protein
VPQSYVEALKWYRLAADQGQAFAQTRLGVLYEYGHGVRQNYAEALTWYRLAADQGRAEAQFFLGNMYVKGQGVPEDYVLAHMWFTLAAAKGDEGAKEGRNMLAEHMTAAQIAEAQRLASEWKPKRKRM